MLSLFLGSFLHSRYGLLETGGLLTSADGGEGRVLCRRPLAALHSLLESVVQTSYVGDAYMYM